MSSEKTKPTEPEQWPDVLAGIESQMPKVQELVKHILHAGQRLIKLGADPDSEYARDAEVELRLKDMRGQLEELEQLGCSFQQWNFRIATVDFPATIDGQDYLICWRSDDEQLGFFHKPGEACSQRRPIPLCNDPEKGWQE